MCGLEVRVGGVESASGPHFLLLTGESQLSDDKGVRGMAIKLKRSSPVLFAVNVISRKLPPNSIRATK